ncbi:MAG TPA: RIP metalloprotease RseP [Steroidobacteraceae bacterium]|nr:RIP metalloprotease RseP [Steroidobacteraceae bacterium]
MELAWSAFWFIVGVGLLVTVHEFGHFWVARKLGFKVLRFSVGFGKPLYKKVGRAPDHTEYVIAAIPLGGYVKMVDEREGAVAPADVPRAFGSRPPWQRILVMLAGPGANFLFAILVLWGLFWAEGVPALKPAIAEVTSGLPAAAAGLRGGDEIRSINGRPVADQVDSTLGLLDAISGRGEARLQVRGPDGRDRELTLDIPDSDARRKLTEPGQLEKGLGFTYWLPVIPAELAAVDPNGPAGKAGLAAGDIVVGLDGARIRNFIEFQSYVNARPDKDIVVTVNRNGAEFTRRIHTIGDVVEGKTVGRMRVEGPHDIEKYVPAEMIKHPGVFAALGDAVGKSWQMTVAQAKFFGRMLTGAFSTKSISGFITIADVAGQTAHRGPKSFLTLMVLLSLSLGFLNLLPVPILDGGQIVFQVVEWIKGSPLSERTYEVGVRTGLFLLALLMGLALFNDLSGILAHT